VSNNRNHSKLLSIAAVSLVVLGQNTIATDAAHAQGKLANLSDSEPVYEAMIGGEKYSVTKMVMHAPVDKIWRVLTDYANAPKVFPQMKKCQVIKDDGAVKIVKEVVAPSGPLGTFSYVLKLSEKAPHTLEWSRVSGSFKEVRGFWKLEALADGKTLVTYASFVDGGFFLPQPFIRRQARIDMPNIMSCLKCKVETPKLEISARP